MVFDDIIADMISPIVTELFIKRRKLNISTTSQILFLSTKGC